MKITSLDVINSGALELMSRNGIHKIMAISEGASAVKIEGANLKIVTKMNEYLIDKGERPKYIISVSGIPGMGSLIELLPGKSHVKRATFPQNEIKTGQQVADYLEKKLNLDDDHRDNDRPS